MILRRLVHMLCNLQGTKENLTKILNIMKEESHSCQKLLQLFLEAISIARITLLILPNVTVGAVASVEGNDNFDRKLEMFKISLFSYM
jgi:hypothetical protein